MITELVKLFFKEENVLKAKELFFSDERVASVNSEHLVRLYKSKSGTINFEFSVTRIEDNRLIKYFQPIGFYDFKKDGRFDTQITPLNEFESIIDEMNIEAELVFRRNIMYGPLSFEENLMIGAVSMNARLKSDLGIDTSFSANGWDYQLLWTYDKEYIQSFPSDVIIEATNFKRPLTAYLSQEKNGRYAIVPMSEFKGIYDDLMNKELLTAYR